MDRMTLGRIGVSIDMAADESHLAAAAEIERLGYAAIWLAGGQLDSLDRIAEVLRATESIRVATGIIPADVFRPLEVARFFAEMEELAPGRFLAGLGGPQKPRPLDALNEYLDLLDTAVPPLPAGRRMVAALGPRKLELARDRSAGAITLLVTPDFTGNTRAALGPDPMLVVDQMIVLDDDPAAARRTAREPLRFLSEVGGYRANFARMGFDQREVSDLDDRLVDALVAWGGPDAIRARVQSQFDSGADHVVLAALSDGVQPGALAAARALRDCMTL